MSNPNPTRHQRAEQWRDYFDVQLRFAARMAVLRDMSLADAAARFTNFHRRFGFGRIHAGATAPGWHEYARRLNQLSDAGARLAWTQGFFLTAPEEEPSASAAAFGCFSFEAPDADGVVRLHFNNRDSAAGIGPLNHRKTAARRDELRRMFSSIRDDYPNATSVLGTSWLYHLPAYRRLFPRQYVESRRVDASGERFQGMTNWGQFLDHDGRVNQNRARVFRQALPELDAAEPWQVFPLPALRTQAPIEVFYAAYGINQTRKP